MTALAYTSVAAATATMGISDANSTAILNTLALAVNEWVESYIGAPVGPGGTAARTYDGDGSDVLLIRQGVQAITTLEIADQTGGTFSTLAATEYVLRPASHDRPGADWPAFRVVLTERATTYGTFTQGYDTVRVTPTAAGFGWAAIPGELSRVATIALVRMFQARQSGEMMVVGSTDFGQAIVRFLPEPEYRFVLDRYRGVISPWLVA